MYSGETVLGKVKAVYPMEALLVLWKTTNHNTTISRHGNHPPGQLRRARSLGLNAPAKLEKKRFVISILF